MAADAASAAASAAAAASASAVWSDAVALFVLLGPRRSTGYRVQVERVTPNEFGVKVDVVELTPPPLALIGAATTAPYQMITVPRLEEPLRRERLPRVGRDSRGRVWPLKVARY